MPTHAIVIHDADKAHAFEHTRYAEAFQRAGVAPEKAAKMAAERVGQPRTVGTEHVARIEEACPEGLPNCRNCGDPAFADSCRAAGHCPDCGTKHGIAPDSVLAAHGFRLEPR